MELDKSRVYTAVNADELRERDIVFVADTMFDLMKIVKGDGERTIISEVLDVYRRDRFRSYNRDYNLAYLVERAAEKKWRPYKDCDEMVEDFKRRYLKSIAVYNPMWHPMIWVKKGTEDISLITHLGGTEVLVEEFRYTLTALYNNYTYLDGSPCGIEE